MSPIGPVADLRSAASQCLLAEDAPAWIEVRGAWTGPAALPAAKFPTQLEESYVALKWIAANAGDFGADGSRIAVAGNSVGGDMSAALTLMAKDRKGPKISYQVLFIPRPTLASILAHTTNSPPDAFYPANS